MGTALIIWYVHGAGASKRSFVWLHQQFAYVPQFFEYPGDEPVAEVTQRLRAQLASDGRPAMLVGHSLGGIIAAICAGTANVERIVTLCAPFGGIRFADLLSIFVAHPLFNDLSCHGPALSYLRNHQGGKPHLAIVGSRGLPSFFREENDGAISVASQTALLGPQYNVVNLNHFEVLLSDDVVDLIHNFAAA